MPDIIVLGGGAAGLTFAIQIKRITPHAKVTVLEQLDRVGKKISITGNGRCNIGNTDLSPAHFHSSGNIDPFLSHIHLREITNFFLSIGIPFTAEEQKLFPRSFQASSVVDALRFAANQLGIIIKTNCQVLAVEKKNNFFTVRTEKGLFSADAVVVATGGLAGGSKLGCNGDGYRFLSSFGHNIVKQNPVIVQVKTENQITKQLKGIKVTAAVSVSEKSREIARDFGEVLFCDYGLSGPPILQLSRYAKPNRMITLDLLPEMDEGAVLEQCKTRRTIFGEQTANEFFTGLLHKRLGQVVLKTVIHSLGAPCSTIQDEDLNEIAKIVKNFPFTITGNTGYTNAQATAGGAALSEFDAGTFMSKKVNGLFAIGEVLDVDGDCGGYNLTWAFSAGLAAAKGCHRFLTSNIRKISL